MTALAFPLQVIDNFLIDYNVGQALLLVFVLSIVGTLPLGSRKVLSLNTIIFGIVFVVTPSSMAPLHFRMLGILLLVVGPILLVTSRK